MTNVPLEPTEKLSLPSEKLNVKQVAEKLTAVNAVIGAYPHSTRELNMMEALIHPIYQNGVVDYVDEVVMQEYDESPLHLAEEMVSFYVDARMNIRDLTTLLHNIKATGRIDISDDVILAALAVVRRHEDTAVFTVMPDVLNAYVDDDYHKMDNAAYGDLLMSGEDLTHVHKGIEATLLSEYDRAAFWVTQITGSIQETDGESVTRLGLIDSKSPDVRAYIAQISGVNKNTQNVEPVVDTIFSIGQRPEIGDTKGWEKFLHRNRLNDSLMLHGFLPQTNKEADKIKHFDWMNNDPKQILKWMDMINESNRRWEVAKQKPVNPKQRLDALVGRFVEYASDAVGNSEHADFVLNAIDEKPSDTELFKDAFPADEWFRDYPEQRLPFTKLVDFVLTRDFLENGLVDNITKNARAKKKPNVQDQIDIILDTLGNKTLAEIAEIAGDYKLDQTNRYTYWEMIINATRKHSMTAGIADRALSQLVSVAPRNRDPEHPSLIHPTTITYQEEVPF